MIHTPVYQTDRATLYCGDCRVILPDLDRGNADLIVTDPPYGVGFRSNRGQNFERIAGDDDADFVPAALALACRVLRPFRHAYVFGPESLLPEVLTARVPIIWDKEALGMGDLSVPYAPAHEPITFGVYAPSKANRTRGDGRGAARMRQGSVIRCQRLNARGVKRHPTEKPVALLRRLIESSSLVNETVLDPFAGSGSTLIAALAEDRRAVGIELDPNYCAVAVERLQRVEAFLDGFAAATA